MLVDLVNGLLDSAPDARVVVFASPVAEREFTFPVSERLTVVDAPGVTSNPVTRFVWLQTRFGEVVRRHGCDVVVNHNNLAGPVPVPQILLLHQSRYFSPEALEAHGARGERLRSIVEPALMRRMLRISASHCQRVVVQTETMRGWTTEWLALSVAVRVVVIPPALPVLPEASSERFESETAGEWEATFAYVGNGSAYKNLEVVYRMAELAGAAGKRWRFLLTVDGGREHEIPGVEHLGRVPRADLVALYRAADALIMPSLVETVGLPMLEAMLGGLPVVAADRPYAHEICAGAALYFEPTSAASLFRALSAMMEDPGVRAGLVEQIPRQLARFPDAKGFGALWMEVIRSLLQGGGASHPVRAVA